MGQPCGVDGAWECDPETDDSLICVERLNECDGIGPLAHELGAECGECGGGAYQCDPGSVGDVICAGAAPINACGGCGALSQDVGEPCGTCGDGTYQCDSGDPANDSLSCEAASERNACGGCGELEHGVGDSCGECGTYACDSTELACEEHYNACGGCGVIDNTPDTPCGDCGTWTCAGDNASIYCANPDQNSCGGCGELVNEPDTPCGTCGTWACSVNKLTTICSGDHVENACGGCDELAGVPDEPCGECGRGQWVCSGDGESVSCVGDSYNSCGGCADLEAEPTTACGSCDADKWLCSADGESVECSGDTTNPCGGCIALMGGPGGSCIGCDSSPCVYACDGQEALQCVSEAPDGFVRIEQGRFIMGSPSVEPGHHSNEAQRQTTLTRALFMQTTQVTQAQWSSLMGNNPACFQSDSGTSCSTSNNNPDGPVEQINWWEALSYANKMSQAEGLPECYSLACTGTAGTITNCSSVSVNTQSGSPYDCEGYRLPTEAEWEYAARAGTETATYQGDLTSIDCDDTTLPPIAWFSCNSDIRTHPVAQKEPNPWGLYDMLGNVYEWVWDWYADEYGDEGTDPEGPVNGDDRVNRGGRWASSPPYLRAAFRGHNSPNYRADYLGFRLARTAP